MFFYSLGNFVFDFFFFNDGLIINKNLFFYA